MERTRFFSAFFCLSETFGLGLPKEAERLGFTNLSTSTRTLSTLTLVGVTPDDDALSVEDAVLEGPAEPLEAVLEGLVNP